MAEKIVDATKVGVSGDATTLNTAAIQKAIDDCAVRGGCTLRFPAGRYLTGTIQIKSKVKLRIEKDAVILGSMNAADYRNLDSFTDGSGNPMGFALLFAVDAERVGIEGSGTIDGQGFKLQANQKPYTMRPFLVRWVRSNDVTIRDVTLSNPGAWTLNFFQAKNVLVEGITIRAREPKLRNSDGINIDSSENVRVRNCDVVSGDDALVIKSTSAARPSRNIVAENLKLSTRTNAVKLGTESIGGFNNIRISNIQIRDAGMAGIALYAVDGGNLQNVSVSDVTMEGVNVPVSIRLGARLKTFRQGDVPKPSAGRLRDVTIENVKAKNIELIGMLINGIPGYRIENLTLKNIQLELPGGGTGEAAKVLLPENEAAYPEYEMFDKVMPAAGIYARHVRGVKFQNVRTSFLKSDARPTTVLIDVEGGSQIIDLRGNAGGKRFDGIGIVNGGGATSVLFKDYPEPQRSQILDLVFKPKFGASVSALFVEIPGDGNSTQGSMPSHMHTRDDIDYTRGYTWWIMREAKKRNPAITLDGTAWSAPGWVGGGEFWSQDTADYYVKWLHGLRSVYGLEFDAIGCRNERGVNLDFVKLLRATLDRNGFEKVKIHAFDNWQEDKFDFVKKMPTDAGLRDAVDILGAHTLQSIQPSAEVREIAERYNKPIWNTEEHVYKKGFDAAISIVEAFNGNFIHGGATKIVNWYDVAGVYPIEPYPEDPSMILAHSPWSGHYRVREALWGYAHYGQFSEVGWQYIKGGSGELAGGGSFVTLKSPANDYSVIIETKGATLRQPVSFQIGGGLSKKVLSAWRSNAKEQSVRQPDIKPANGAFTVILEPDSIYTFSTTRGQQKGSFDQIPESKPFPFPYHETFEDYSSPKQWGFLPRYTADISGAFELADCPDKKEKCLRQTVPVPTLSWAPDWKPYSILGDAAWQNYEVSVDVYLHPGESAGVMGRINHVGDGWGFIPKGYFLELFENGECRLVVVRGKPDKKKIEGDAEQQALIKAGKDDGEGGEKVLASIRLANIKPNERHNLKLRFDGSTITAFVDQTQVLTVTDPLYSQGMAGMIVGAGKKLSMPYFDNLMIKSINSKTPAASTAARGQTPIYGLK